LSSKTALVFGSKGQDGCLLSKSLLLKNYKVIGLARCKKERSQTQIQLGIEKDIIEVEGDITNNKNIENLICKYQPHEIYNLAAQSSVGKSFSVPQETIESIVHGTLNILEVAKNLDYKGKLFFAGSSEIFGETEKAADINHSQNPRSPYAIAKQASYNLVKLYREIYNIQCVTGILFNHESPYRSKHYVTQKIICGAIKCKNDKSNKVLLGNIDVARDWGWAEEYIEAIQLIANSNQLKDQLICTGKLTKLKRFIEIAFKKLDLDWKDHVQTNEKLSRKSDILKSYGNPSQLKKDLQWEPKIQIEEIVEKLLEKKI
jgi:GDPmannose 4,6-dehydratase